MSKPEVLLWTRLRRRQLQFQFRRQRPLGPYVADFYCHELLLVIEVDGASHDNRGLQDVKRDAWMRSNGYFVLRLTAKEVLGDIDGAVERVILVCEGLAGQQDPRGPARV